MHPVAVSFIAHTLADVTSQIDEVCHESFSGFITFLKSFKGRKSLRLSQSRTFPTLYARSKNDEDVQELSTEIEGANLILDMHPVT